MMTKVRLKIFDTILVLIFLQLIFVQEIFAAQICTKLVKPTRYAILAGDDFYSILKNFKLEPVIGDGGSLAALQKINNVPGQTSAEVGKELTLPFKCEEQVRGFRLIDKGEYRLITGERIDDGKSKEKKIKTETIGTDEKTKDILNKSGLDGEDVNLDEVGGNNEEVSDALRYRMICDGEWTGTECITRYSALYVTGGVWYNRYDGEDRTTGGQGVLLSKLNPEIGLGWSNYWTENFRTDLGASMINNDIHPEIRERPIEQAKKTLNTFYADARYEVGKWGFSAGIQQRERLFYRFFVQNIVLFDDGGVVVNAIPLLDLHAHVSYMFRQSGKFRFDGTVGYTSIMGGATSGYTVTPGSAIDIGISVQHDRVKEYLFGTIKYEMSQQDTEILLQKATELGLTFGYAWKLKDW